MTPLRAYLFRTPAQWSACLFDRVDNGHPDALRPIAPFQLSGQLFATPGAHAPAVTCAGEVLWTDDAGFLHRLTDCDDAPVACPAPYSIAHARRLVSAANGLWVTDDSQTSLQRYDQDTLTRLSSVSVGNARVIDVAGDGYHLLFALIERDGLVQAIRVDCSGRIVAEVTFEGISQAKYFVYIRRSRRFVVLADDPLTRLYWFADEGGPALLSLYVAAMHPCFSAYALGSDSRSRIFLAGSDAAAFGGQSFVLILDGDGVSLGEVPLDARDSPATGVTGTPDSLLVTGPRGLLRHSVVQIVPDGMPEVRCSLITPMLQSPQLADRRRWLRIEATASLPEGASLEISYAATDDPTIRDRLIAIGGDRAPASHRVQKLLRETGIWSTPFTFHGSSAPPDVSAEPLSAPLFDVHEQYVWVCITLSATAGGSLPSLEKLAVLYQGATLMDNLPAVYRRAEAQPGSFLRSLVGVLECTTQGLDARIAALGSYVNPSTAPTLWLNSVARWLGLPWDDALDDAQKKCILAHAADLARARGTRAGLETLLECLLPGIPQRFRVTDTTADVGFATVGGQDCRGSALPALLAGRTVWSSELNLNAMLGRMRLPCPGQIDDAARDIVGRIGIEVAASGEERRRWEPWLARLINEMVPLTARVRLAWVSAAHKRDWRLDGSWVLEAPPAPHLGTDAITGVARLPDRGSRITNTGADIGTRLQ